MVLAPDLSTQNVKSALMIVHPSKKEKWILSHLDAVNKQASWQADPPLYETTGPAQPPEGQEETDPLETT